MDSQNDAIKGFQAWIKGTGQVFSSSLKEIAKAFRWICRDARGLAQGILTGNRGEIQARARALCWGAGHFFNQLALLIVFALLRAVFGLKRAGAWGWRSMTEPEQSEGGE